MTHQVALALHPQASGLLDLSLIQWALAAFAVVVIGLSKGGIKGVAIIIVTIMALVFGGKESTGIIVPLLIVGDIFAVAWYNKHAQWNYVGKLLPWMLIGIVVGALFGDNLDGKLFQRLMAVTILISVLMMIWSDRRGEKAIPDFWWFAALMGLAAGFATMIGNLAGAFTSVFFLAMRVPKNHFIGTVAWLFLITNTFKVPFHFFMWETITMETLSLNVRLLPALVVGLVIGVQVVKMIRDEPYRKLILILTGLGAVLIFLR